MKATFICLFKLLLGYILLTNVNLSGFSVFTQIVAYCIIHVIGVYLIFEVGYQCRYFETRNKEE